MTTLLLCLLLVLVFKSCLSEDWCYQSQISCVQPCKGPAAWNEVNSTCAGNRQSPINILTKKTKKESSLTDFKFTGYDKIFSSMLKNTGKTVSLDIPLGATVSGGNLSHTYNAIQLHFHWGNNSRPGSEHTLDGEQYPMEDTYITVEDAQNDPTGQAILGFFFEESDSENQEYSAFIAALAQVKDAEGQTELAISLNSLILSETMLGAYYRYEGSETTPGCSESVIWTIFEQPIPLSRNQLVAFSTLKFKDQKPMVDTFRPGQPRKGRVVYLSHSGAPVTAIVFSFFPVLLHVFLILCFCHLY
ncbi:hypothetical protein AMELA_G00254120 [Ameiurus melas]|uniref:Carbonic anhydrase 4 n=1 Tax=Ameiurus melas TaxID=219545 RepID=A0A7J5ZRC4_AMEME|nr:hypothetical protein AMELA_G00254120 [Ameiurus melas]